MNPLRNRREAAVDALPATPLEVIFGNVSEKEQQRKVTHRGAPAEGNFARSSLSRLPKDEICSSRTMRIDFTSSRRVSFRGETSSVRLNSSPNWFAASKICCKVPRSE